MPAMATVVTLVMICGTKQEDVDMKKILMIFAAMAAIVSCRKAEEMIQPQAPEVTITAEHLKTVIDDEGAVTWDGDEEISVLFTKGSEFHIEKYENANVAGPTAKFVGTIKSHVKFANGWNDAAYCVCPSKSVDDNTGKVMHSLPAEQYAHASHPGSFESGLNLSYAPLSLKEIEKSAQGQTIFQNALSVLRLVPGSGDITSITIKASDPLVGKAPMVFDAKGNLVIDQEGTWVERGTSVVLKPSGGTGCFNEGVTYNILVYPGTHTSFSVTLNYKEYGDYTKTLKTAPTFLPAKYYTLGFTSDSELIITQMNKDVEILESRLPSLDELEGNVEGLLNQIQSVSLMTEYLDNAVYAQTNSFNNGVQHMDVVLDYIVKPESAAQALVEAFNADPSVAKGVLAYKKSTGYEDAGELAVNNLVLSDAPFGKYVTASVSAANISSDFYDGKFGASLALLVKSGETEILSDFANLVPKSAGGITGSYLNDIPAIPGARVVIPFSYAVSDPSVSYTLTVGGTEKVDEATVTYDRGTRTGNLTVQISEEHKIKDQTVTLVLTVGEGASQEVISQTFTFADSGSEIKFVDPGQIDWIGGEYTIDLVTTNINTQMLSCSGAGVSQSGGNVFVFDENTGAERTVEIMCTATIPIGSLNYYKILTLTQTANGTDLSREYYSNGKKVELNKATAACANYFNIVILGDGYKKRDLLVGGKFEKRARSAMDSFFAIEPYTTFKNRFNVYMVAYESEDEGTDIRSSGIFKNTYFDSYCIGGGNTQAYADVNKVTNVVKYAVGSDDAVYYRSIAILLINTDEQAGSTGYPFRDYKSGWPNGYASFAIAALAANSTGTNGLVKHEAGGHAFGRLADEYYTGGAITLDMVTELNNWHAKGWYWNVTTDKQYWNNFTNSGYKPDEVGYVEGAWNFATGIYRPTSGGMMQNNSGVFNAPSRHAIYHRIITESEGANAYSWDKFTEYDKGNRKL